MFRRTVLTLCLDFTIYYLWIFGPSYLRLQSFRPKFKGDKKVDWTPFVKFERFEVKGISILTPLCGTLLVYFIVTYRRFINDLQSDTKLPNFHNWVSSKCRLRYSQETRVVKTSTSFTPGLLLWSFYSGSRVPILFHLDPKLRFAGLRSWNSWCDI